MAGIWKADFAAQRERLETIARHQVQEQNRTSDDAIMEQCVVAYAAHIAGCGMMGHTRWADFRADWFKHHGIMEEQNLGR